MNQIDTIINEFGNQLRYILGTKLYAAYSYGAVAFDDSFPTGDIDFHVVLNAPLTQNDKHALENMHKQIAEKFPPIGEELDGYYILLDDTRRNTPPTSQMWNNATDDAWALHREHIRAGYYIKIHGPDPKEIYPPTTWEELEIALIDEFVYIKDHLTQYPDYCIMNLSRLLYSFRTKDVVTSKARASAWAMDSLPKWKNLIVLARKSYQKLATSEERTIMIENVRAYYNFAISETEKHIGNKSSLDHVRL